MALRMINRKKLFPCILSFFLAPSTPTSFRFAIFCLAQTEIRRLRKTNIINSCNCSSFSLPDLGKLLVLRVQNLWRPGLNLSINTNNWRRQAHSVHSSDPSAKPPTDRGSGGRHTCREQSSLKTASFSWECKFGEMRELIFQDWSETKTSDVITNC